MPARSTAFSFASLAFAFALAWAPAAFAKHSVQPEMSVAQTDGEPAPTPPPAEPDPGNVFKPKTYPVTPADVAECMKSWDAETGMSKEEYRKSCEQTLKYFPEGSN